MTIELDETRILKFWIFCLCESNKECEWEIFCIKCSKWLSWKKNIGSMFLLVSISCKFSFKFSKSSFNFPINASQKNTLSSFVSLISFKEEFPTISWNLASPNTIWDKFDFDFGLKRDSSNFISKETSSILIAPSFGKEKDLIKGTVLVFYFFLLFLKTLSGSYINWIGLWLEFFLIYLFLEAVIFCYSTFFNKLFNPVESPG